MVEPGIGKQVDHRAGGAGLGIWRAEHHPLEPGVQHGTRTHRTRLERNEQLALLQPIVAQRMGRCPQGMHFGVGRRVQRINRCIAAGGYHLPLPHQHGADGDFTGFRSLPRLRQRQLHEIGVAHGCFFIDSW